MRDRTPPHPDKRLLIKALAAGLMGAGPVTASSQLLGRIPAPLPAGQSIYDMRGPVTVNNDPASMDTVIRAGDVVATGQRASVVFVVGQDAFLLRENSQLQLAGSSFVLDSLKLVTGAVLSVFGATRHQIMLPTATIGIRGTGLYAVAQPDVSYLCTCYGIVDIAATGTDQAETVESMHHDSPRYIAADGDQRIRPAPFIDHTDDELMLIETLVGRRPPFALFDPGYGGRPRY